MSRLTSITAIARTIDPQLRTHQFHLAVAVLGGLIVMAVELEQHGSIANAIGPAANAGVTVFLAWAIAREIDPDEARTANLAAILAVAGRLLAGPGNLGASLMFLLATRIALRSTGLKPTLLDGLVFLPAAAFFAGRTVTGWVAALTLAYALARDHRLPNPAGAHSLVAAFVVSATASAGVILSGAFASGGQAPGPASLALMAAGIVAGLFLPGYVPVSKTDYTAEMLDFFRLRSARWTLLGGSLLTAVVAGGPAMAGMSAIWVVLVAATLIARNLVPAFGPG
ncbi:MAG: hypothetical protein OEM81_03935 [Acidimicrobiia bacterium]|nr:hypothetical protein [Acidimicrobiia bacterium]MDH3396964.1 hypothetical protein [Acidimicrobiia bacterium]